MSSAPNSSNRAATDFYISAPIGTMLVVGEFTDAKKTTDLCHGLRSAGWDVIELESSRYLGGVINRPIDRLLLTLFPRSKINSLSRTVAETASAIGVDCVLFCKGMGANPELINELHRAGRKAICWYPDVSFDHPVFDIRTIPMYDLFLTNKYFHIDYLAEHRPRKPTAFLETGYCPSSHFLIDPPIPPNDRPFDCIFVGNHSAYKEQWLRSVITQRPNLAYAIVGGRWKGATWADNFNVYRATAPVTGNAMARLINHAKIGIALHHGPVTNAQGWADEVSARTFEIPACGSFMLHIDNAHVRTLFDIENEIRLFSTVDQLVEKIDYFLSHPVEREDMARRAYRRVVPSASYMERGRTLAKLLAELPDERTNA